MPRGPVGPTRRLQQAHALKHAALDPRSRCGHWFGPTLHATSRGRHQRALHTATSIVIRSAVPRTPTLASGAHGPRAQRRVEVALRLAHAVQFGPSLPAKVMTFPLPPSQASRPGAMTRAALTPARSPGAVTIRVTLAAAAEHRPRHRLPRSTQQWELPATVARQRPSQAMATNTLGPALSRMLAY